MTALLSDPRTAVSAARTTFYGSLAAFLGLAPETAMMVDAVLVGAIFADYVTWLPRALVVLPNHLWHGTYDGAVNALFAVFFLSAHPLQHDYTTEALATSGLAFLLVLIGKVAIYCVQYARYSLGDS